jgi:DNA-binding transcriptional LysR family regulator
MAPMLAHSDLIATLPLLMMQDRLERYGLQALKPPIMIEPMSHRLIWSARLSKEPALRWFRTQTLSVLQTALTQAHAALPA